MECGRSRPTVKRSDLAGWANYGYCASHSRWFWGLRLYLITTPAGMPILWALADPKIGEREVLAAMLDVEPQLAAARPGLILITDKGFAGRQAEADLAACGITLLRPSRKDEAARYGEPLLKSIRQLIESVNDTLGASSTSKPTAAGPSKASPSASPSASWPWPPPSGTTTRPGDPSPGR